MILCLLFLTVHAQTVSFENNLGNNPLFNLTSESPAGVEIVFSMHDLIIEEQVIDGQPMNTFGVPGMFLPNDEGAPNIMGTGRYIAVPQGARAQVTIMESRTVTYENVDIAPAPNIPAGNDDSPLRYQKDPAIYGRNAYYPDSPVLLSPPKKMRGVDVVILGITPFQYNPVTRELIVYSDLRIRVDFIGGNGHFGEDRLRSRFWDPVLQGHLLNYNSLPEIDYFAPERVNARAGFEYIIIVPNDAVFEAWADTIKRWRKLQGISCEVYTLTEVGGSDSAHIKSFLQNAYNTWDPAPVAFLILSDYPGSGDIYGITSPTIEHPWPGYASIASDSWYADYDNDSLPEVHFARITAQDNADLNTMITKMLTYERNPYTSANFYDNPLVACAWQTDRWFQLFGEVIRGFFINGLGKNPARQYAVNSGTPAPGCPWSSNANTRTVVQYWYNVGWLDDTLNQQNSTWWSNGSAAGITNAINSGAFLVQHRDHGSIDGWDHPPFHSADLDNLTTDQYPFVYSTNCLTGRYQSTSQCFAEKFHRISHGALGVNCPSAVSPSFVNDTFIWGTYDCLWPRFDPGYPFFDMTGYDNLRPCMAMTYGLYYLNASGWPYNPEDKCIAYLEYHHHGDAFMTIYSEIPQNLTVSHAAALAAGQTSFTVSANDSSVIALTVNGEIIGVGEGAGAPQSITIPGQPEGSVMVVTVTKANYRRYSAFVPVVNTLVNLISYPLGNSTDYTAISAYRDTVMAVFDYLGTLALHCRYLTSYNGGSIWFYGIIGGDTTTTSESPDVACRDGGGEGVVYRYYASPRELRYTWRAYTGGWSTPLSIADHQPYFNQPSIEHLGSGKFGVVYSCWNAPVIRGAYFDCDEWIVGAAEHAENSEGTMLSLAPNPSRGRAKLVYNLNKESTVRIVLYDVAGRLVNEYLDQMEKPGTHELIIDNHACAAGIYFLRMENEDMAATRMMIITR